MIDPFQNPRSNTSLLPEKTLSSFRIHTRYLQLNTKPLTKIMFISKMQRGKAQKRQRQWGIWSDANGKMSMSPCVIAPAFHGFGLFLFDHLSLNAGFVEHLRQWPKRNGRSLKSGESIRLGLLQSGPLLKMQQGHYLRTGAFSSGSLKPTETN